MSIIGNIIWVVFGGLFVFLEYFLAGVVLCITIVGIPFGYQLIKLSALALWPFGTDIETTRSFDTLLSLVMNIIWILFGGIWIALTHVLFGVVFFITINGIPFAAQHFKLARVALTPFGARIR